jgi:hypothetical protein
LLVEEVVLSPRMERQVDMFRGLLERLQFRRPVRASALLVAPF